MKITAKIFVLAILALMGSCDEKDTSTPVFTMNSNAPSGFLFEEIVFYY